MSTRNDITLFFQNLKTSTDDHRLAQAAVPRTFTWYVVSYSYHTLDKRRVLDPSLTFNKHTANVKSKIQARNNVQQSLEVRWVKILKETLTRFTLSITPFHLHTTVVVCNAAQLIYISCFQWFAKAHEARSCL